MKIPTGPSALRFIVVLLLAPLAACGTTGHSMSRASVSTGTPPGLAELAYGDFGALTRDGFDRAIIPWKLVAAALLLQEEERRGHALSRDSLGAVLAQYGFLEPARIANWEGPAPGTASPALGLVTGRVPLGVPGLHATGGTVACAACHAGTTYDASGRATGRAWLGLPNSSIALDLFADDLTAALRSAVRNGIALLDRVVREYPDTPIGERMALRFAVLSRTRRVVDSLAAGHLRAMPFRNGAPGNSNGIAAIKRYLRAGDTTVHWADEAGWVNVPNLTGRVLRTSFMVDGVYAPRGVDGEALAALPSDEARAVALAPAAALIVVPAMGVPPDRALRQLGRFASVMTWLAGSHTPPFPAVIDTTLAREGALLFDDHCARCHGTYAESGLMPHQLVTFPNRTISIARLGTDRVRLDRADSTTGAAIEEGPFGPLVRLQRATGYVAPVLSGVWATAPYLHNGSVPSIWALLSPEARPITFEVGGHALDYASLGVLLERGTDGGWRYPAAYVPASRSAMYDTRAPGQSNAGHRFPSEGLSDADKRRLIEYLKTL